MELHIAHNNIDDTCIPYMVESLANITTLKNLGLSSISPSGWIVLSDLLQNSKLEELDLVENAGNVNNGVMITFANALVNNNTLKTLRVGNAVGNLLNNTATKSFEAFSNLLCTTASICRALVSLAYLPVKILVQRLHTAKTRSTLPIIHS